MRKDHRALTEPEKRIVALVKSFEEAAEARKSSVQLSFHMTALDTAIAAGIKVIRVELDRVDNERVYAVLLIEEYSKYVDLCCNRMGLDVQLDGTIFTKDNIRVTDEMLKEDYE